LSQNKTSRIFFRFLAFGLSCLGLLTIYQSCDSSHSPEARNYALYNSKETILTHYLAINKNNISESNCSVVDGYRCELDHYSNQESSQIVELNFPCQKINSIELCAQGVKRTHFVPETTSQSIPEDSYSCYYNLPGAYGEFPLRARSNDISTAVFEAHSFCMRVNQ
jgi:hypothetical protein